MLLSADLLVVLCAHCALIHEPPILEFLAADGVQEGLVEGFLVRDGLMQLVQIFVDFDLALAAVSLLDRRQVLASVTVLDNLAVLYL